MADVSSQFQPSTTQHTHQATSGVELSEKDLITIQKKQWGGDTTSTSEGLNIKNMLDGSAPLLDASRPLPPKPNAELEQVPLQQALVRQPNPSPYENMSFANLMAFEEMQDIATYGPKHELSKQTVDQIRFYNDHPELTPGDSKIAEYVAQAKESSLENLGDMVPKNWKTESSSHHLDKHLTLFYEKEFEKLIEKLPPEKKEALRYAFYHPEQVSDALREELTILQNRALDQTRKIHDFPKDWAPPLNSFALDDALAFDYSRSYENALKNFEPPLSQQQINHARLHNYHPEMADQVPKGIVAVNQAINTQILNTMRTERGLPPSWQPNALFTSAYDATLVGEFLSNALNRLSAFSQNPTDPSTGKTLPLLSDEQIAQIKYALVNPEATTPPPLMKSIAKHLSDVSIQPIRDKFSLPPNWIPPLHLVNKVNFLSAEMQWMMASVNAVEDDIAIVEEQAKKEPDSSDKMTVMDFLKSISDALVDLKLGIYEIQASDAAKAKDFTMGELEAKLAKVDKQLEALKKAQKARKKAKSNPISKALGKVFKVLVSIAAVATAFVVGGPAFAAVVATLVIANFAIEMEHGMSGTAMLMKETEALGPVGSWVAKVAIVLVIGATISPMYAIDVTVSEARIIQDALVPMFAAMGMGEMGAIIAAEITTMIIVMVVAAKAPQMSGKAAAFAQKGTAPEKAAQASTQARTAATKATSDTVRSLQEARSAFTHFLSKQNELRRAVDPQDIARLTAEVEAAQKAFYTAMSVTPTMMRYIQQISAVAGAGSGAFDAYTQTVRAEWAMKVGDLHASLAELDALIRMMSKMIQKMYTDLSGEGSYVKWSADVQHSLDKLWGGASSAVSKLHSSV